MEKANLKKRIIAIGCVGAVLIGTGATALYHSAGDVEAKTTAFHGISKYQNNTGLKILEITPKDDDVDLGYWIEKNHGTRASKDASYGNIFLKKMPSTTSTSRPVNYSLTLAQYNTAAGWVTGDPGYNSMLNTAMNALYNQYKAKQDWGPKTFDQFKDPSGPLYNDGLTYYNSLVSEQLAFATPILEAHNFDGSFSHVIMAINGRLYDWNLPSAGGGGGVDQAEDMSHALMLRRYGLVKPTGATLQIAGLREYPWWDTQNKGLFSMTDKNGDTYTKVNVPSGTITTGWYEYNTNNTGAYNLAGGYVLGPQTLDSTVCMNEDGDPLSELEARYIYRAEYTDAVVEVGNTQSGGAAAFPEWLEADASGPYYFAQDGTTNAYVGIPDTIVDEKSVSITDGGSTGNYDFNSGFTISGGAGFDITGVSFIGADETLCSYIYDASAGTKTPIHSMNDLAADTIYSYEQGSTGANGDIYKFVAVATNGNIDSYITANTENTGKINVTEVASSSFTANIEVANSTNELRDGYYTTDASDTHIVSATRYKLKSAYSTTYDLCMDPDNFPFATGTTVVGNTLKRYSFYSKSAVTIYTKENETVTIPNCITIADDGHGNVDFKNLPNFRGPYGGYPSGEDLYFNTGTNKYYAVDNWLAEYILGDAQMGYGIDYNQMSLESDAAADIVTAIKNYDLIYFSGTADEYAAIGNIDTSIVKTLYEESAINHKAVMMDYALYSNPSDVSASTNIDKLCYLLWQEDQLSAGKSESYKKYFDLDVDGDVRGIADIDGLLADNTMMSALKGRMLAGYNGNFAVNNVYVYDHCWENFMSSKVEQFQTNAHDVFANGDLNSPYIPGAVSSGFWQVTAYITYNNSLPDDENGRMTEGYVTPAIAIQFILCYRGELMDLSKGSYKVLEIEPTLDFRFNDDRESKPIAQTSTTVQENRKYFIKNCIDEKLENANSLDSVQFFSMTVDEFDTVDTDILHDYDVVYIGCECSKHYAGRSANCVAKVYNDTTKKYVETMGAGFPVIAADTDATLYGNVYYNGGNYVYKDNAYSTSHYSGRDLTGAKFNQLKDYLDKGGLIIVNRDMMYSEPAGGTSNTYITTINPTKAEGNAAVAHDNGRVDTSSNMYELLMLAKGITFEYDGTDTYTGSCTPYLNLVSEGDLASGYIKKETLKQYLNRERISLTVTQQPDVYAYNAGGDVASAYLKPNTTDNRYYLDVQFSIASSAGLDTVDDVYTIKYYQDTNADGQFSPQEEKSGYRVTYASGNTAVGEINYDDGTTVYQLKAGVAYRLRREVPSDEGGYVNWCIKVSKIGDEKINTMAKGYTVVKPRDVKYINILQIMPRDASTCTVNLENVADSTDTLNEYLFKDKAVTDRYQINVRTVTTTQFNTYSEAFYNAAHAASSSRSDAEIWAEFFNKFQRTSSPFTEAQINADESGPMAVNMIVLGFGNNTSLSYELNTFGAGALMNFIESNKPVLTSYRTTSISSGIASADFRLRNFYGVDRYGVTVAPGNQALYGTNYDTNIDPVNRDRNEELAKVYLQGTDAGIGNRELYKQGIFYGHNTARKKVFTIDRGFTNFLSASRRTPAEKDANPPYIIGTDAENLHNPTNSGDDYLGDRASGTRIDIANEGMVSHYPYTIEDGAIVAKTYADYWQADLDSDSDGDGSPDLKVWCTLGEMTNANGLAVSDLFSGEPRNGINNYYVYNYGNVTYTGYGRNALTTQTEAEKMLFVNTIIAAYESGLVNPTVNFYDGPTSNSDMITSVVVPYDGNITKSNTIDSSIRTNDAGDYMYKFIDPNQPGFNGNIADATKAYFKVQDSNFVRDASKHCRVHFYLEVEESYLDGQTYDFGGVTGKVQQIQLNDNSVKKVVPITINVYSIVNGAFGDKVATASPTGDVTVNPYLEVGTMYGIYLPMSYLNDRGVANIYIQADTSYDVYIDSFTPTQRPLGTAYGLLSEMKQDLLKLD